MSKVFDLVYQLLKWLSKISGFTYREINIIVYFIIIPSLFFFLLSKILKQKYIVISFLAFVGVILFLIPDFESFSSWLFDESVNFLNWFKVLGLDYIQASVVICVLVPILILLGLLYLNKNTTSE